VVLLSCEKDRILAGRLFTLVAEATRCCGSIGMECTGREGNGSRDVSLPVGSGESGWLFGSTGSGSRILLVGEGRGGEKTSLP